MAKATKETPQEAPSSKFEMADGGPDEVEELKKRIASLEQDLSIALTTSEELRILMEKLKPLVDAVEQAQAQQAQSAQTQTPGGVEQPQPMQPEPSLSGGNGPAGGGKLDGVMKLLPLLQEFRQMAALASASQSQGQQPVDQVANLFIKAMDLVLGMQKNMLATMREFAKTTKAVRESLPEEEAE